MSAIILHIYNTYGVIKLPLPGGYKIRQIYHSILFTKAITMHVLILGGGLGGLALAQTLRKQGISFEIFERDENENCRFQGWAIALHTYESIDLFGNMMLTGENDKS